MKQCMSCGQQFDDAYSACPYCGQPVAQQPQQQYQQPQQQQYQQPQQQQYQQPQQQQYQQPQQQPQQPQKPQQQQYQQPQQQPQQQQYQQPQQQYQQPQYQQQPQQQYQQPYGQQQQYQQPYGQQPQYAYGAPGGSGKSKTTAGILGLLLGGLGVHYFYFGKPGGGLLCLLLTVVTCGLWGILTLVQCIMMLTMTQEEFDQKYVYTEKTFPLF